MVFTQRRVALSTGKEERLAAREVHPHSFCLPTKGWVWEADDTAFSSDDDRVEVEIDSSPHQVSLAVYMWRF